MHSSCTREDRDLGPDRVACMWSRVACEHTGRYIVLSRTTGPLKNLNIRTYMICNLKWYFLYGVSYTVRWNYTVYRISTISVRTPITVLRSMILYVEISGIGEIGWWLTVKFSSKYIQQIHSKSYKLHNIFFVDFYLQETGRQAQSSKHFNWLR